MSELSIEERVKNLNEALLNKKNAQIIEIIMESTRDDRNEIRDQYDAKYNPNLLDQISKSLKGDFKNLVTKCFLSIPEFDATELEKAFKAFSTDEDTIYEILISRPKSIIDDIKQIYEQLTGKTLEKAINRNIDKQVKEALLAIINTERNQVKTPNYKDCEKKADMLIKERPENWLSNSDIIYNIFTKCSPEELVLVCRYFKEKTGNHIQNIIEKLSKVQKKFLTYLIYNVSAPAEHYAYRLCQSVKGIGTNNSLLERILVTRYDLDMELIKSFYYDTYKITAREDVEDDTQGVYRDLLIRLLNFIDKNNDL